MEDFMKRDLKFEKSRENFEEMEKKFRTLIHNCNKKNLIDTIERKQYNVNGVYDVKNATKVEHYLLDDNIHIYKFFNDDAAINYWVSSLPIYKRSVEQRQSVMGQQINVESNQYNNVSFLEYTCGGSGNSLGKFGKYYMPRQISSVVSEEGISYPITDIIATKGNALVTNYHMPNEYSSEGDLFGFIKNYNSLWNDDNTSKQLSDLKDVITKIENYYLNNKDREKDKKGLLKNLLKRNKTLNEEIDAFSNDEEKRRN